MLIGNIPPCVWAWHSSRFICRSKFVLLLQRLTGQCINLLLSAYTLLLDLVIFIFFLLRRPKASQFEANSCSKCCMLLEEMWKWMCARILVAVTMKLTHFDKEILLLNFFYMLRHGIMWKTQLMGIELPACHLNKGLLEMCFLLSKGILLHEVLSQKCTKDCYNKKVHKQRCFKICNININYSTLFSKSPFLSK